MTIFNKWYTGLALALIGVAGVLAGTADYGPGMSPDSTSYVECARHLLDGEGFHTGWGLYVRWPPLFPILLAGLGLLGLDVMDVFRFFNAACFGLIIYFVHRLFAKDLKFPYLVFTGAVTVLLFEPLLKTSMMVLSEPLYTLLTVFFVMSIHAYTKTQTYSQAAWTGFITGMAALTRYYGVSLILCGGLIILLSSRELHWKSVVKRAGAFGLIASLPLGAWLLRNFLQTGSLAGPRGTNPYGFVEIIEILSRSLTGFIMPQAVPPAFRLLICAAALFAFLFLFKRFSDSAEKEWTLAKTMAVTVLVCTGFLLYSYLTTWLDPTADRYLAPVQFAAVFLALYFVDSLIGAAPEIHQAGKLAAPVVLVLCTLWMGGLSLHVISRSGEVIDNPEKNLAWMEVTSNMHPSASLLTTKGNALLDLGEFSKAAESFEQAAKLSRAPGPAWIAAGKAAIRAEDYLMAVRMLENAKEFDPVAGEAEELLSQLPPGVCGSIQDPVSGHDSP